MAMREGSALVFAALGDETRLKLVARLCERGPLSITELTSATQVTRQAVTKHLRVLEEVGLLRGHWQGRERIFALEPRRLEIARRYLDQVSGRWDNALDRLRKQVEADQ